MELEILNRQVLDPLGRLANKVEGICCLSKTWLLDRAIRDRLWAPSLVPFLHLLTLLASRGSRPGKVMRRGFLLQLAAMWLSSIAQIELIVVIMGCLCRIRKRCLINDRTCTFANIPPVFDKLLIEVLL